MRNLVSGFILFSFLVVPASRVIANTPYPCTENLVTVMTDSGMTNNESERVCYVARYYITKDSKLSKKEAIMKALRRVGVWDTKTIESITKALNREERAKPAAREEDPKKQDAGRPFIKFELDSWGDRNLEAQLDDENGIIWSAIEETEDGSKASMHGSDKADGRTWIDDSEDRELFENAAENVGIIFGFDFMF